MNKSSVKNKCPYFINKSQCKKGWYMITLVDKKGKVIYICPNCSDNPDT